MVVAFATVVVDANGARALVLRRGCETLVAMPLGCTNVEHCGSIVRLSLIGSSIAPVFLHLEDATCYVHPVNLIKRPYASRTIRASHRHPRDVSFLYLLVLALFPSTQG